MAGYIIYSLDRDKFQSFVNNPTDKQLLAFAEIISDSLDGNDDEFEEGDPVQDWPSEPEELCGLVKKRLARQDWYADLSDAGKSIWDAAIFGFCCHTDPNSVGFRVDHDGVYWDVVELAWKHLEVAPDQISPNVALSAFGRRPYRYNPPATEGQAQDDEDFDAWDPMHSMHTPDEVRKIAEELKTAAPTIERSRNQQAIHDYDSLLPIMEKLAAEGRMLFVQTDT